LEKVERFLEAIGNKNVEKRLQKFLEKLIDYYCLKPLIKELYWLPYPCVKVFKRPMLAVDYDPEENQIELCEGEINLHNFLHEFYHLIQNYEWSAQRYRIYS